MIRVLLTPLMVALDLVSLVVYSTVSLILFEDFTKYQKYDNDMVMFPNVMRLWKKD